MAGIILGNDYIERYWDGRPVNGPNTPVPSVPVNATYPVQPFIPGTLVTGADIQEFFLPAFFSAHVLKRLSARLTTPSTSGSVGFRLELYTGTGGAFVASQTSDTFVLTQGVQEIDLTSFTAGLTANGNNKMRIYILNAGTGAAHLDIKTEWLKT